MKPHGKFMNETRVVIFVVFVSLKRSHQLSRLTTAMSNERSVSHAPNEIIDVHAMTQSRINIRMCYE